MKKTYLIKDKEAYIVAKPEIDGAHGLPRDIATLTNELQQVLNDLCKQSIGNIIQHKTAQRYNHRGIKSVNREDEEVEGQK